uniref:Si:dkey-28d5.1 n=1 Tax=Neogobius melanostomus TaxID=47308 RepID=A0A8C6SEF0_9GOBI
MLLNSQLLYFLFISGRTYEDAKSYCREMVPWIGLEIANKRMWHWSLPGHTVDYTNWREGNPQENDTDACGAMDESGKWFEIDCNTKRSFVCHSNHMFVAANKTWRNAQNHCRNISTDLVRILSAEENEAVRKISQNSWIGLFKDPWKWSDGSNSSFRYWRDRNLVLIRQNFTWIEAIIFCRSHYIDLVHISTEDVQKEVAEKVKNATTPHVWIGLKYICSSNIWFWTKSSSGCYQNWAPQQGSERNYTCGVTGAIEATGRQQWVGLPQTEKLNFICYACTG